MSTDQVWIKTKGDDIKEIQVLALESQPENALELFLEYRVRNSAASASTVENDFERGCVSLDLYFGIFLEDAVNFLQY